MKTPTRFFRNAILIPIFLFQACVPSLSKGILQSVSDFLQLRSLANVNPSGPYHISVTVSGLLGSGLVVDLNAGTETKTINTDGSYQFTTTLTTGSNFNVTISTQPTLPVQTCSVSGGMGVVGFGDINSIIVNCDPLRYTVGGTITGLDGITGLVLTNSVDGSTLSVAVASGSFAFTQTYLDATTYNVSVTTQPNHPVQNCVTTNGSGTIAGTNITNITIACTSIAFPIEITAVGIASGTLSIRNNNSELLTISTNGLHRFPTNIITNNTYSLQIISTPANHQCILSASGGTVTGTISVIANCFSVLAMNPSNGGVLQPTENLRLQFSDEINAGSCTGSTGTLNTTLSMPIQFAVATTTLTNDTLIVSPAATDSWASGHKTLTLNCNSVGGYPLSSTVNLLYLIPSSLRYVADATGNDLNDGLTPLTPKRNIQAAINSFASCPTSDCAVLVEGGSYDPAVIGGTIQLVSGISLYGSYVPTTNYGTWNPDAHSSVILMDTTPAGCSISSATAPCASIIGDASVTNNVTISGFRIQSGPDIAPNMAGVFLNSTNNVRLINNDINGGSGTNGSSGVHAINSNPYLIKNTVDGGLCGSAGCYSVGLYISSTTVLTPIVLANIIAGGNIPSTVNGKSKGIQYIGSTGLDVTNIRGNQILGQNVDTTTSTTSDSIGFDINAGTSSTGILSGNIITSSAGYNSMGIRISPATSIQIGSTTQGNLITSGNAVSGSYGIWLTSGHIVRRNQIQTGNTLSAALTTSTGILSFSGGTATIENNALVIGNATSTAATGTVIGIYGGTSFTAASSITGNYMRLGTASGGTATSVSGIQLSSPLAMLIANNWIQNGISSARARGIELSGISSAIRIYHNTVNSGSGSVGNEAVLYLNNTSSLADIQNNVFLLNNNSGNNACIYNAGLGLQTAIRFNVLFNCLIKVHHNSLDYTDLCAGGIFGTPSCVLPLGLAANFGDNLILNPNFVSNFGAVAVYTPQPTTSCLITKSTNQIITNSYNGNGTRPGSDGAVSLGAVEYDQVCTP
ncbi:beta strand repeat-containing protein [Leptospira perdikensis]|uniref:DUF1565 domain-containing protein n=1 Tax=Leptospira perdikensis TaxID=2484948 RepID=A0A4R9JI39_9LEPT|nr:hypothetical protein [Leptospira perdikensis]TGL39822.1 hypothetical protein EHQ49_10595 [Leptospira perdikensis]